MWFYWEVFFFFLIRCAQHCKHCKHSSHTYHNIGEIIPYVFAEASTVLQGNLGGDNQLKVYAASLPGSLTSPHLT